MGSISKSYYHPPGGTLLYKLDVWPLPEGEWPLHPFCVEEAIRDNYREYHEDSCRYMVVTFMLEGCVIYSGDGSGDLSVESGSVLIIPQGASYSFHSMPGCMRYHKLVLEVKGPLLQAYCAALRLDRWTLLRPMTFEALVQNVRGLAEIIRNGLDGDLPTALGAVHELLTSLSQEARSQEPVEKQLVFKAKAHLEDPANMGKGIAKLAAELGVSQSVLDKAFKQELGVSPRDYRLSKRAEIAKYYLVQTGMSMKEIALRLGYANQLYFSNDFSKRFGVSPKAYRKQQASLGH